MALVLPVWVASIRRIVLPQSLFEVAPRDRAGRVALLT